MRRIIFSAFLLLGARAAVAVSGRWEVIGPGPASPNLPGVSSLAFSDRGLLAAGQNGLYRRITDDDWNLVLESIGENVNSSLPNSLTWVGVAPGSPQVLLTGAGNPAYGTGGIYRSADAGASWKLVLGGWGLLAAANAPSDPSVVYASVFNGFPRQASTSRSTDGGVTWTQLTALGTSIVYAFGVDSTSSDVVYAAVGASDGGLPAGLYRSSDGGTNWAVL
ncbi:MAG TPA: hypothetical protein VKG23_13390, partial [Thermoanaerobaculia bacterium]|nr:hypothetical protein [Thermoanaerobaculia bacterium]